MVRAIRAAVRYDEILSVHHSTVALRRARLGISVRAQKHVSEPSERAGQHAVGFSCVMIIVGGATVGARASVRGDCVVAATVHTSPSPSHRTHAR